MAHPIDESETAHDTRTPDIHTAGPDYARRFAGPIGDYLLDVQTCAAAATFVMANRR